MNLEAVPGPESDTLPRAGVLRTALALTARMHECETAVEIVDAMIEATELGPFTVTPSHGSVHRRRGEPDWTRRISIEAAGDEAVLLTVQAQTIPTSADLALLESLVHHAQSALETLSLRARTASQTHRIDELSTHITRLEREAKVHRTLGRLTTIEADETAIARSLHELTGLVVGIEDSFGNLRVWIGPRENQPHHRIGGRNRAEVLRRAATQGHPFREGNRILQVIRPGQSLLGILYVWDPNRRATDFDTFALEYAATVLATEMSHQRSLAETEARLRRTLGADLLAGTDDDSAYSRADALGYDLRKPQRVLAVRWGSTTSVESIAEGLRRHFTSNELAGLLVDNDEHGTDVVAAVTEATIDAHTVYTSLERALSPAVGVIGVGSECRAPSDLPRSYTHALRALEIRKQSLSPVGVVQFDELGVYRILDSHSSTSDVESFVDEWLGPLLDYDRAHRSTMTVTLAQYLECGGKYDETARALSIHRSTLRYRMSRIHDLTGHDLRSVDTRLNLHLATRALQVLTGEAQSRKGKAESIFRAEREKGTHTGSPSR